MKNFILGVVATIGGFAILGRTYNRGYDDAINHKERAIKNSSNKNKKAK